MKRKLVFVLVAGMFVCGVTTCGSVGYLLTRTDSGRDLLSGFKAGILGERAADIQHPKVLSDERCKFQHPGNWTVETPDHGERTDLSLESPGLASVVFVFFDGDSEPADNVETLAMMWGILFKDLKTEREFTRWGAYEGYGVHYRGFVLREPSELRVFSYSGEERSFVVTEVWESANAGKVRPGFEWIERTFELVD
jgi:hypothetical protein